MSWRAKTLLWAGVVVVTGLIALYSTAAIEKICASIKKLRDHDSNESSHQADAYPASSSAEETPAEVPDIDQASGEEYYDCAEYVMKHVFEESCNDVAAEKAIPSLPMKDAAEVALEESQYPTKQQVQQLSETPENRQMNMQTFYVESYCGENMDQNQNDTMKSNSSIPFVDTGNKDTLRDEHDSHDRILSSHEKASETASTLTKDLPSSPARNRKATWSTSKLRQCLVFDDTNICEPGVKPCKPIISGIEQNPAADYQNISASSHGRSSVDGAMHGTITTPTFIDQTPVPAVEAATLGNGDITLLVDDENSIPLEKAPFSAFNIQITNVSATSPQKPSRIPRPGRKDALGVLLQDPDPTAGGFSFESSKVSTIPMNVAALPAKSFDAILVPARAGAPGLFSSSRSVSATGKSHAHAPAKASGLFFSRATNDRLPALVDTVEPWFAKYLEPKVIRGGAARPILG